MSTELNSPAITKPQLGMRRRILRIALVITLIAAVIWLGALIAGEWARSSSQNRLIEAGLPTKLEDALLPIESSDNAADAYTRIFIAMSSDSNPSEVFRPDSPSSVDPQWSQRNVNDWSENEWEAFAERLRSQTGLIIAQALDKAGPATYCRFNRQFNGPSTLLPEVSFQIALATHCQAAVQWHLKHNDEEEAIRWLLRWQRFAYHAIHQQPFLINLLVGIRIESMLHELLSIHGESLSSTVKRALKPNSLNRADLRKAYILALHGERIEFIDGLLDGPYASDFEAIGGSGSWYAGSLLYRPVRAFEHASLRDNHLQRVIQVQTTDHWDIPQDIPSWPIGRLLLPAYDSVQEQLEKLEQSRMKSDQLLSF